MGNLPHPSSLFDLLFLILVYKHFFQSDIGVAGIRNSHQPYDVNNVVCSRPGHYVVVVDEDHDVLLVFGEQFVDWLEDRRRREGLALDLHVWELFLEHHRLDVALHQLARPAA